MTYGICKNGHILTDTNTAYRITKSPKREYHYPHSCLECERDAFRKCYAKQPELWRKYLARPSYKAYRKKYEATGRDPIKVRARFAVRYAVKVGKLTKLACFCGNKRSQAHHPDYSKPLEVIWLCSKHHGVIHRTR